MAKSKVDFRKPEKDMALIQSFAILNMECTCDSPDCEMATIQQIAALAFVAQILDLTKARTAKAEFTAAFRETFG